MSDDLTLYRKVQKYPYMDNEYYELTLVDCFPFNHPILSSCIEGKGVGGKKAKILMEILTKLIKNEAPGAPPPEK